MNLTPSERRVSRLIQAVLGFTGADRFVQRHGARKVIEALKRQVLEWQGADNLRTVHGVRIGWHLRPGIRNGAGLLRWTLESEAGR